MGDKLIANDMKRPVLSVDNWHCKAVSTEDVYVDYVFLS